jgi:hypothetical protein
MTTETSKIDFAEANALIGTFRRFGPVGEIYEIIGVEQERDGERLMRIRLPKTGEQASYPVNHILDDPKED